MDRSLCLLTRNTTEYVSPKTIAFCLKNITCCLNNEGCFYKMAEHMERIMLEFAVPLLALNEKDCQYWKEEPVQFVYSNNIKTDDHCVVKNAAEELIQKIASSKTSSNGSPLVYSLVNFVTECLKSGRNARTSKPVDDFSTEYLLHSLECVHEVVKLEKSIRSNLAWFFEQFIVPQMTGPCEYLRARACSIYSRIGYFFDFPQQEAYFKACQGISACLADKHLPVQVAAAGGLSVLLFDAEAKHLLKGDLRNILQIILDLMNEIEFDGLVQALEGIISEFEDDIDPFAGGLIRGLMEAFFRYKSNSNQDDDPNEAVDEAERAAEACLDTINNILRTNLEPKQFQDSIVPVLTILNSTIKGGDQINFEKSLGLLNLLLYKNQTLSNDLVFYYPLLCYLIVGKPNKNLSVQDVPEEMLELLEKVGQKDGWLDDLSIITGCLLNYIQKLGEGFLKATDFYGLSFPALLFEVIKKIGSESIETEQEWNLIYSMKILMGFVENLPGLIDDFLPQIVGLVRELLSLDNSNSLTVMILQVVSCLIWYNPHKFLATIESENAAKILFTWFENLELFSTEVQKKRELWAFSAILSVPSNLWPNVSNSLIKGLQQSAIINQVFALTTALLKYKKEGQKSDTSCKGYNYLEEDDDDEDVPWEEVSEV